MIHGGGWHWRLVRQWPQEAKLPVVLDDSRETCETRYYGCWTENPFSVLRCVWRIPMYIGTRHAGACLIHPGVRRDALGYPSRDDLKRRPFMTGWSVILLVSYPFGRREPQPG